MGVIIGIIKTDWETVHVLGILFNGFTIIFKDTKNMCTKHSSKSVIE